MLRIGSNDDEQNLDKDFFEFLQENPYVQKLRDISGGYVPPSAEQFPGSLRASDVRRIRNLVGRLVIEIDFLARLPDRGKNPDLDTAYICLNGAVDRLNDFVSPK